MGRRLRASPAAPVIRIACTILLAFEMSRPASAGDAGPMTAILLVARTDLVEANISYG